MNITIIGGDLRQITLAKSFEKDGAAVTVYGINSNICPKHMMGESSPRLSVSDDVIILPMPVTFDGVHVNAPFGNTQIKLDNLLQQINIQSIVFGGKIPQAFIDALHEKGVSVFDYANNEELMIKNAVPTAEGALALAINETPFTIWKSKCLIAGWGRIGKALARILNAMGTEVTIAARSSTARAEAQTCGFKAIDTDKIIYTISSYDIIFNTIPAKIFTKPILEDISKDAVLIDLASKPGGVDFNAAKNLGVRVIWALSLPGKIAPITSGEIIKETITDMLGGVNNGAYK